MTQARDYGRQIGSDPVLSAEAPFTAQAWASACQARLGRGMGWAVTAFVIVVLAVGGLYIAFPGWCLFVDQATVPTPTTVIRPAAIEGTWVGTDTDGSNPDHGDPGVGAAPSKYPRSTTPQASARGASSTMAGTSRFDGASDSDARIPAPCGLQQRSGPVVR